MRYLTEQEVAEILALRANGGKIKDIAAKFGVCEATVYNIGQHKTSARKNRKSNRRNSHEQKDFEEQEFASLPDDVFFQHVRVWDFIG